MRLNHKDCRLFCSRPRWGWGSAALSERSYRGGGKAGRIVDAPVGRVGLKTDSQLRIAQRGKAATKLIRTHELMKMERGISRKTGNAGKQDRLRAIPEMN